MRSALWLGLTIFANRAALASEPAAADGSPPGQGMPPESASPSPTAAGAAPAGTGDTAPSPPAQGGAGAASAQAAPADAAGDGPPTSEAQQLLELGVRSYEAGEYAAALEHFQHAFTLAPNPGVLFNIGAAHAALGHCDLAADAYRRYIEQTRSESGREDAERQLQRLNECTPAAPSEPLPGAPEPASAMPERTAAELAAFPVPLTGASTAASPPLAHEPSLPAPDAAPSGARIAGWAAIGSGAALFAGSMGCAYAAARAEDRERGLSASSTGDAAAREQAAGKRYDTLAWGLGGGSAALLASGLLLLLLEDDEPPPVHVAAAAGPAGVGLALESRF